MASAPSDPPVAPSVPAAESPVRGGPNLQMYVTILHGIQDQIRFADAKAGFIAGVNAIMFCFLASHFDTMLAVHAKAGSTNTAFWLAVVFQLLYLVIMAIAVCAVILSVMPRLSKSSPESKVFFGHIRKNYGRDWQRYVAETSQLTDQQWAEQIGTQIVEVSQIAWQKHRLVRQAAWFTLAAFALWRASLAAIAFLPEIKS